MHAFMDGWMVDAWMDVVLILGIDVMDGWWIHTHAPSMHTTSLYPLKNPSILYIHSLTINPSSHLSHKKLIAIINTFIHPLFQ